MKYDINAFNLLRFGLLPGIAILVFTLVITAQWSIALEILVVAAIPLLLGCLALTWMFSSFGSSINQRLNDSIEKAEYLRPSYILCMFVLVSMTVAVLHILWHLSPDITLPLILVAIVLLVLSLQRLNGHSRQIVPPTVTREEGDSPITTYGYKGEEWTARPTLQQPSGQDRVWHTDEQPQAYYHQVLPPPTR